VELRHKNSFFERSASTVVQVHHFSEREVPATSEVSRTRTSLTLGLGLGFSTSSVVASFGSSCAKARARHAAEHREKKRRSMHAGANMSVPTSCARLLRLCTNRVFNPPSGQVDPARRSDTCSTVGGRRAEGNRTKGQQTQNRTALHLEGLLRAILRAARVVLLTHAENQKVGNMAREIRACSLNFERCRHMQPCGAPTYGSGYTQSRN